MSVLGIIRVVIKFPIFALLLVLYFLASILIMFFFRFNLSKSRPALTHIVSLTGKVGLKIIGINVIQKIQSIDRGNNYLIVSNHLSYIDVLVISYLYPSCFVTSKEMKKTFFLGQLCMLGGCLFVDRQNRQNIHNEVRDITSALSLGLSVAIFPEAKSTDGSSVIQFRRPLFQAAIDSESKILPMCLNYKSINSDPVSLKNRDIVCWYGEMPFLGHAIKLFSCQEILVELNVLQSFSAIDFADKNILAEKCHEIISGQYYDIVT